MTYYLLLLFFGLEWVRPTAFVPALLPLHLNTLSLYGAAFASIFGQTQVSNAEVMRQPTTKILLALLAMTSIQMVVSDSSFSAWEISRGVFEYILLYWVITKQVTTLNRLKGLFWTLVLSNIAVALLTPSLLTSAERLNLASGNFLGDANDFALSVNLALPLCLFLLFESKARARLLYIGALLLLVYIIIMTQSRGGTLALMAVGAYYWLKSDKKVLTGVLSAAAVTVVLALAPSTYWERMANLTNTQEGSAEGRIEAWRGAMRMSLDHPIFGVGPGRFAYAYGASYRRSEDLPFQTAHSVYFLALGELGFPGLIFVLAFIIKNMLENRRTVIQLRDRGSSTSATYVRLLNSTSASLVAFSTGAAFLSALYFPHIFVLSGFFVAARRLALQSQSASTAVAPSSGKKEISYHWALRPAMTKGPIA